jgi:hypothetical protein
MGYWDGGACAGLEKSRVSSKCPWLPGKGMAGSANAYNFINRAFEIFWRARNKIKECPNKKQRRKMTEELEDAGTTGNGWGISDLAEAFDHYVDCDGGWNDTDADTYHPDAKYAVYDGIAAGPTAIVNFMNALEGKAATLGKGIVEYQTQVEDLANEGSKDGWDSVGDILDDINTWGGRVKKFLWLAPKVVEETTNKVLSATGVLKKIHEGVDTYFTARDAGFPDGTSAAIAALKASMEFVPLLGGLYGKAVDLLPKLKAGFGQSVKDRQEKILAIARST